MTVDARRQPSWGYVLYDLRIESCVPLPLPAVQLSEPDVRIVYGTVPETLEDARVRRHGYEAAPGRFLLTAADVAGYLVSDGREIVVERSPRATDDEVRVFLLGSIMGALLHQRGELPLHGSAVEVGGGAVVLLGCTGHGKSTTAGALYLRGHRVLTDDVSVVDLSSGRPKVRPGFPLLKLHPESLRALADEPGVLDVVSSVPDKALVSVRDQFHTEAVPLDALYVLAPGDRRRVELDAVENKTRLEVLLRYTYRPWFLEGLGWRARHLHQCVRLLHHASVTVLHRPARGDTVHEVVRAIEEDQRTRGRRMFRS